MDPLFEELESSTCMAELLKSHYLLFVVQRMLLYLSKHKIKELITILTQSINKIKDKKVSMGRWMSFLEKYSDLCNLSEKQKDNSSINTSHVDLASKYAQTNNCKVEAQLGFKPLMSPEITPSKILSPLLNPYSKSNANQLNKYPVSPVLISHSNQQLNMMKYPNIINPGLINPLNRFRPNGVVPQINHNQIIIQNPINNINYHIVSPSQNQNFSQAIPSYNTFTNTPQYYVPTNQCQYSSQPTSIMFNKFGNPNSPELPKFQHNINQYTSK